MKRLRHVEIILVTVNPLFLFYITLSIIIADSRHRLMILFYEPMYN